MSGALDKWYSLPDLQGLAQREAILAGEIELARLDRLGGMLRSNAGSVSAEIRLGKRAGGWLTAELRCSASLSLVCQRCLEPIVQELVQQSALALLETESLEALAPKDLEPLVLDRRGLRPVDLIEDELIMSLPLVPRHRAADACDPLADRRDRQSGGAASTHSRSPDEIPGRV
jgi:uncharacterized protein